MESNNNSNFYELTHAQKRIWYMDKVNLNSPLHNIGGCLKINGSINVEKMIHAINLVVQNNEGLRLRFKERNGLPFQYVYNYEKENIDFMDFSNFEIPRVEHEKWSVNIFKENFLLEDNQLYYFSIYKISEKEWGLLLKIHHIISDGWSISVIEKQVCEVYSKLINDIEVRFSESNSYLDVITEEKNYFNSKRYISNKNFWNEKFNRLSEEFLYSTTGSLKGKRKSFNIDSGLAEEIYKFTQNNQWSLNTFFISIILIYLNKITNEKDLVIGTPVFNRSSKTDKNTIGMFTSTVPLRFELDSEFHIERLIKAVNRELKLCFVNQKYPYDMLIRDLGINQKGFDSLFKLSVNYYNFKYVNDIDEIDLEVQEYYSENQSYSLQLAIKEWEENTISLNFDYKIEEYSEQEIEVLYKSLINIIRQILTNNTITLKDIKLLCKEEIKHKVESLNSTSNESPSKTIRELFEDQVIKTPNEIALEFEGEILTYKGLNEKSNQLAGYLKEMGVQRESIVGIMASHSIELVIAILGVIKAGGAYLPIDPDYPVERINFMLEDSGSTMLLTNFMVRNDFEYSGNIINVCDIDINSYSKENLEKVNRLDDLVYIIYTSGSTGKPKGVMIENSGLTNYVWWARKEYLRDDKEVMALYSSISFDLTVTSIFTPLISGNKIVIYENNESEYVLFKILRENKVTVIKLTPAHLSLIKDIDNSKSNINRLIIGGEDLKRNLAEKIHQSFNMDIEIYNEYGPTETVVGCMIYKYNEDDKGFSVPIGLPIDNTQIYILDSHLDVVPSGISGELFIGGKGVARGYLNREDLTGERFIQNPYKKGQKIYRTGDIARYLDNGVVEYIGRNDDQVKIRGYRIEVGEIEKYLLENEAIKDAIVAIKEDNRKKSKFLNAYIVAKKVVAESEIKIWLLKFLPEYMVPENFILMENLPLTTNGKVNYALLPNPLPINKEFVKYNSAVEKELVGAMEEILGIEKISLNDNFFQLGGDSIKAIQISSILKNVGLDINVKDILTHGSIYEIAAAIEVTKSDKIISQGNHHGDIESTPIIEWFFNEKFHNENLYNQYVVLEFEGAALDSDKVSMAANKLVQYHDSLRINYDNKNQKIYYNQNHLNKEFPVNFFDLSNRSDYKWAENINSLVDRTNTEFNIGNTLLFNVTMLKFDNNRQGLLFTAHHLIVDGISWRIILNDFITILKQLESNDHINLLQKTNSFKEWAEQLNNYKKENFKVEVNYWNSILEKKTMYPVDTYDGKDTVKTSHALSGKLSEYSTTELIKNMYELYNVDINELLVISLALTLNKQTANNEVMIELERHGREQINEFIDVSRTVGWFTSMYPTYFKIDNKNLEDNIKSLKEQLRSVPNKGFNYSIIKYLNKELIDSNNKYIRFNYLGDFDNIINKESLNIVNVGFGLDSDEENSLTALMDINSMIVNKELKFSVTFSNNRFKVETIQTFINSYLEMLTEILEHCTKKGSKEFTPSDFDGVDISQEEIDNLFI